MKYDNYYSGSDAFVYFESKNNDNQVYLDKLYGIGYRDSISSMPIYGLGDSEFAFISKGNVILSFSLDVNVIHENYLTQAIHFAAGNIRKEAAQPIDLTSVSFDDLSTRSIGQLRRIEAIAVNNNGKILESKRIHTALLHELPRYFTTRVIFNNSQPLHVDEKSSGFLIIDCVVISKESETYIDKDGQMIQRYNFVGKYRPLWYQLTIWQKH